MFFMNKFQGKVFAFQAINGANDPALTQSIEAFKDYWGYGFHPYIGKDVVTSQPNPPEGHRHCHLKPTNFNQSYSGTSSELCWSRWEQEPTKIAIHWNSYDIPTSDHGLFYFVDVKRNAYIYHYQHEDFHNFMKSQEFKLIVQKYDKQLESLHIELMTILNQATLFNDEWLIAANDES